MTPRRFMVANDLSMISAVTLRRMTECRRGPPALDGAAYRKGPVMIVRFELSCLSCGYEMGDVEGEKDAPLDKLIFLPVHQGDELVVDARGQFRCPRCKGR